MRYLKMLGAAAVVAAALTAFVGAGTASATALYSGATKLGAGTEIQATLSGSATLTTTEGTVLHTCTGGEFKGKTTNAGGAAETVKGTVEKSGLTWTNCTVPTSTISGGEFEWHWLSALLHGTLTIRGITITIASPIFGTCTFGGSDWGTVTGSTTTNAVIDVNSVLTRSSGLCPSTAKWVGTYKVTKPVPFHVTAS